MAMTYQNFASLGVNLNRQKYGPLDISNVFTSENDLKYYLSKGAHTEGVSAYWYKNSSEKIVPYPYEGQVLATVIDGVVNVYTLSLDAEGNFQTQEIAGKIEVDGTTIVKDADGKLSIVAPVSPDNTKSYNFTYVNGKYSWVEVDTATAAGQTQAIKGLQDRTAALEDTVNGKSESVEGAGDAVVGLVEKVATNTSSIASLEGRVGNAAIGDTAATGLFKAVAEEITRATEAESALGERIDNITIPVAGVAAEDKILALGTDKLISAALALTYNHGTKEITLKGKNDEVISTIDATPFIKDGMLDDVAYDAASNTLTFTWNTAAGKTVDSVVLSDIIEPYTAGAGLRLEGNEFAVKVADGSESFLTTDANGIKLSGIQSAINLAKQDAIDSANATAAGQYAIKTFVGTLPEGAEATTVVAYIDEKATDVINTVRGETTETVASVATDLQEYITSNDTKVNKNTEDIGNINTKLAALEDGAEVNIVEIVKVNGTALTPDANKAVDIAVPTKFSDITDDSGFDARITAAKEQADKGVSDASVVAAGLAALTSGTVADNTRRIDVVEGTINTLNTTLTNRVTALEEADEKFNTDITTLQGIVKGEGGHASRIAALETRASNLETRDGELDTAIKANTKKFEEYTNTTGMNSAIATAKQDVMTEVDKKANVADVYTKTEIDTKVSDLNTVIAGKANASDVYTKEAADAAFMTEAEVDARIDALILASDPDSDNNKIENIQNLVKYVEEHGESLTGILADVSKNKQDIATNAGAISTNASDIAALKTGLAAVVSPKESDEISVATDGTLGIKEVNVNKLVQTEGDTLVIYGGGAKAKAVTE